MAKLKLMRADERTNRLAEMFLFLNGRELGVFANGETKEFNVLAGRHKLKAKIDSYGRENYSFNITEGETKVFALSNNNDANKVEPFASGIVIIDFIINGFLLLYYFTLAHNKYIAIKEVKHPLK